MVIAYLMIKKKFRLKDALTLVRERRAIAKPNPGFCEQLLKLEKKLYDENSITFEEMNAKIQYHLL